MTTDEKGHLFVFEGPDGVGKSSLHGATAARLSMKGPDPLAIAFPGNRSGTLGAMVYDLHHSGELLVPPLALQTLHVAAHIDALVNAVHPAVQRGGIVLLDRSWWSTQVYGLAQGIPGEHLQLLIDVELAVWGTLRPTRTFLIRRRSSLQEEDQDLHGALSSAYALVASNADHPVSTIDNEGSLEEAAVTISERISADLGRAL